MSKKGNKITPVRTAAPAKKQAAATAASGQAAVAKISAERIVFIVIAALLAAVIIVSSLLFFIPLINDTREKNFYYLTSDLSYYLDVPEEVYKDITLNIEIARPRPEEVESAILYYLAMKKDKTPLYDGTYQQDVTIDVGDKISFWYRAYTIEDGKEKEFTNNFSASNPSTIIVGEGSMPAQGLELALVNAAITPNDTPSFAKITEGTTAAGDVVYVTYTELLEGDDEKNSKKYTAVRIDLADSTVTEKFGEGFINAITGATIGEEGTAQSVRDGKTYNYTKLKVEFATRCEGDPFTLEGYLPFDYASSAYRNKTVYYELYIAGVVPYNTPAFDDAFITEMLSEDGALVTLEELNEYPGDDLAAKYRAFAEEYLMEAYEDNYDYLLEKAIWKHYTSNVTIKNYPTKKVNEVYQEYYNDINERFEASGGVITDSLTGQTITCSTFDQFASVDLQVNYTGQHWRSALLSKAESLVRERLILYYIMRKENFVPTDEQLAEKLVEVKEEYLEEYMKQFLESINKDRDDYTDEEYDELVEERREVLYEYFDEDYFKENTYYRLAMETIKTYVTVKTFDDAE